MRDHAATEELLQASGGPFTSLRNGFYATTVRQFMGPALQTGTIELPEDGPVSWTTHADLAEAAAAVDPTLATLLGRTPTGMEAFLRDGTSSDTKA
jgi:NAD(P)H dehydrogenase (quinone)